jgi:nitrite reductase/ring-hydroxylating ferredoxin subunit
MKRWMFVCPAEDLKPGQAASVLVESRQFAVFNVDGVLYGLDAICRHQHANLAAGQLFGNVIECAMHGWEYDVITGECLTIPDEALSTYPVKVEDDQVWIEVDERNGGPEAN